MPALPAHVHIEFDRIGRSAENTGYLAPEVELLDVEASKRVCSTCCDMEHCSQRATWSRA